MQRMFGSSQLAAKRARRAAADGLMRSHSAAYLGGNGMQSCADSGQERGSSPRLRVRRTPCRPVVLLPFLGPW